LTKPRITTLENGMRVVSEEWSQLETVAVGVWVDMGSRHETEELNGVAHFLEHMMFKGTGRRTARDIAEDIEAVGGQLNAYTSRDYTTYYAKVMKEDLPLAVDLLADILQHSQFDPAETRRERDVILQELGQAIDTPDDIIFDYMQETAFQNQALGRSILGSEASVSAMTSSKLKDYMSRGYQASRMVLAAVGNLDHDVLVDMASRAFDCVPKGHGLAITPAHYSGGELRKNKALEQLHLTLAFPGVSLVDPDYYAMQTFSTMLGGGMSSRLFQTVREERGLAYSVYSFSGSHDDSGLLGIYAGTGAEMGEELVDVIVHETHDLIKNVSVQELERAKIQLKAGMLMALEGTNARVEQLARHLMVYGEIISVSEIIAKVDAVDIEAVQRVAHSSLSCDDLTMAYVGPGEQIPNYDVLKGMFKI
jgi:predicted Zn-dependent peptidase